MAEYVINNGLPHTTKAEADYFQTSSDGQFVDFLSKDGRGGHEIVLRIQAKLVMKVEKK